MILVAHREPPNAIRETPSKSPLISEVGGGRVVLGLRFGKCTYRQFVKCLNPC